MDQSTTTTGFELSDVDWDNLVAIRDGKQAPEGDDLKWLLECGLVTALSGKVTLTSIALEWLKQAV